MKRLVLIITCCLIITGCSNKNNDENSLLFEQYNKYEEKLSECKNFIGNSDEFSIRLIINKAEKDNYRYDIIIDSPLINMYHLQAIAKVEGDDSTSLPTLGILEDEVFSLIPGVVDKPNGIYKGVNLSGITSKSKFYVLIYLTFTLEQQSTDREERYIKLYGDAS